MLWPTWETKVVRYWPPHANDESWEHPEVIHVITRVSLIATGNWSPGHDMSAYRMPDVLEF